MGCRVDCRMNIFWLVVKIMTRHFAIAVAILPAVAVVCCGQTNQRSNLDSF